MFKKAIKLLVLLAGLSIFLITAIVTIAQTAWFKSRLETRLHEIAQESGVTLTFKRLEGSIPLRWEIEDLTVTVPEKALVHINSLRIRIAFFPLLRKQLGISSFKAKQVSVTTYPTTPIPVEETVFNIINGFPFDLSVHALRIENVSWKQGEHTFPSFYLQGSCKLFKDARDIFCKLTVKSLEECFEQDIFAVGGRRKGFLEIRLKSRLGSLSPFKCAYELKARAQIDFQGPWDTWRAIALKEPSIAPPLTGQLFGSIEEMEIPHYELLNQPWKIRGSFEIQPNRTLEVKKAFLRGPLADASFQGFLLPDLSIKECHYSIEIPSLAPFSSFSNTALTGLLKTSGVLDRGAFDGKLDIEKGSIGQMQFDLLHASSCLTFKEGNTWEGALWLSLDAAPLHLEGDSTLVYIPGTGATVKNLALLTTNLQIGGDLSFNKELVSEGTLRIQSDDLSVLDPLFPNRGLGGRVGIELEFLNSEGQAMRGYAKMADFAMRHLKIAEGTLSLDLRFSQQKPIGSVELQAERIYLPSAYFATLDLHAHGEPMLWQFTAISQGTWKEPFQVEAKGSFDRSSGKKVFTIDNLDGTFLSHRVKIQEKTVVELADDSFSLDAPSLQLANGRLSAQYHIGPDQWRLSLQGNDVPLALLTLFTPYLSLHGESTIVCAMQGTHENVRGSCQLSLRDVKARRFGEDSIFQAKGALLANFEGSSMQLHSELKAYGGQAILLDATIPLEFTKETYFPFKIDTEGKLSSSLLFMGNLEEFSEFVNTGFHRWKGWIEGKLLFSGSLSSPLMLGDLSIYNGAYENDVIGLRIENLEADIEARRDEFFLTSLHANGLNNQGTLVGTGNMQMRPAHNFPYHFYAKVDHLPTFSLNLVEATLTGPIEIEGTSKRAIARGIVEIDEAAFSIPRTLPTDIPNLPVTYIHQPAHVQTILGALPVTFPFEFDLTFHSNDSIYFDTNNLTSRWGGDLHVHGVNLNLLASGTLRLAKGQFTLLGKNFKLSQGEISFTDKPGQEGILNISGTLNMPEATITAQLRGILTAPQLSLESVPPLATSDIFSLILFNKKITEIKPLQAVQLAHTVMSFSGSAGWNFVGQIGSGLNILGIDTFDIVPSEQGLNQTSITIGKQFYLVRGVMISLTQSLSSSRFIVEVDLGGGLIAQAENESSETQSGQVGKFSLKWNKNY